MGRGVGDGARSGEVVLAPFSEFFGITPDYCQERSNDKKMGWGGGGMSQLFAALVVLS